MNSSNEEPLNKRLERLRKAKGMTAREVAALIGVPESTYREWEYGRGLKIPPLQKLSEVLAISVTELLIGQKPERQELIDDLEVIEQQARQLKLKIGSLL